MTQRSKSINSHEAVLIYVYKLYECKEYKNSKKINKKTAVGCLLGTHGSKSGPKKSLEVEMEPKEV